MLNPIGKYKKAYESGKRDFLAGKKLNESPWLMISDKAISSWWTTGWQHEELRQNNLNSGSDH